MSLTGRGELSALSYTVCEKIFTQEVELLISSGRFVKKRGVTGPCLFPARHKYKPSFIDTNQRILQRGKDLFHQGTGTSKN